MLTGNFQQRAPLEPNALRAHRLFESRDLDDTRERISRVMQPHEVHALARPVGRRDAHMDFLRIGGIGLGTIAFGEAVRIDVGPLNDYHLLMFCLQGNARTMAGGMTVDADTHRGVSCAAGQSFEADLSGDCEQFVVRLDRRSVEAHCGRAIEFDPHVDLRSPRLQAWLDQLRVLTTSTTLVDAAQRNPLIATELERLLIHLLLEGQGYVEAPAIIRSTDTARRSPASGVVRRAELFIDTHADEPLRLGDIADAAGVPARTLLDAFKRFRDVSPMQHLRDVRLDRARDKLQSGDAGVRVASVAMDCGFAHLGRFSQAYQARFGEAPSVTLGRSS